MDTIRIGRISSIDYSKGTAEVTYADQGNSVTAGLPFLANGEYKLPNVGDMVLVLHLSNDSSSGVIAGTFWNDVNIPGEAGKGIYKREMASATGSAFIRHNEGTGETTIKAQNIVFECDDGRITASDIIKDIEMLKNNL